MSDQTPPKEILSDKPLVDPEFDELGYKEFARGLSNSIVNMAPEDGFVMAVYGAWGSGKTTLLNFVRHYLKQQLERPIVIEFNPWWFSDDESLIRNFLSQLEVKLGSKDPRFERIRENLSKLADVLAGAPSIPWYPSTSLARKLFALGGWLLQSRIKKVDVVRLKELIAKDLKDRDQRIVVIVDDIDRLTGKQIRQLFRIVKAVGNFPRITYLLAFDKVVVEKALEKEQDGIKGSHYLEKIVQIPMPLPIPEPGSIHRMLTRRLDALIVDTPEKYWEPRRWTLLFHDPMTKLVKTPRHVTRLINSLQLTYPSMNGNVNPVDFIGINLLSIVRPELYDMVRTNPDMFTGIVWTGMHSSEADRIKPFHESWRNALPQEEREAIESLLANLFPKLDAVFGNTHHSNDDWQEMLRVAHKNVFNLYFQLSLPKTSLVNTEMMAIISLAKNQTALEKKLLTLTRERQPQGTTRMRDFLERLEAYTANAVPRELIANIVKAFLNVGDSLSPKEDEPVGMFDFGSELRISRVLHQLLRRLDPQERFEVLRDAVQNGASLSVIAYEVGSKERALRSDRPEASESAISEDQLKDIKQIALEKVREAARTGSLSSSKGLPNILHRWREWAGDSEPRTWVQEFVEEDRNVAIFLERFAQKSTSTEMETGYMTTNLRLNPQSFERFVDPASIVQSATRIRDDAQYSEDQRKAAGRFLSENEMRQRGLDPDNPLAEREMASAREQAP